MNGYDVYAELEKCYYEHETDYDLPLVSSNRITRLYRQRKSFKEMIDRVLIPAQGYIKSFKYSLKVDGKYVPASVSDIFIGTKHYYHSRNTFDDFFVTVSSGSKEKMYNIIQIMNEIEHMHKGRVLRVEPTEE